MHVISSVCNQKLCLRDYSLTLPNLALVPQTKYFKLYNAAQITKAETPSIKSDVNDRKIYFPKKFLTTAKKLTQFVFHCRLNVLLST